MLQHRNPACILSLSGLSKGFQTQESYLNSSLLACSLGLGLASLHNHVSQCLKINPSPHLPLLLLLFLLSIYIFFPFFSFTYRRGLNGQWEEKKLGCFMIILFIFLNISILISFYPNKCFWLCEYIWNLGAISFCLKFHVCYSPWFPVLSLKWVLVTNSACVLALTHLLTHSEVTWHLILWSCLALSSVYVGSGEIISVAYYLDSWFWFTGCVCVCVCVCVCFRDKV